MKQVSQLMWKSLPKTRFFKSWECQNSQPVYFYIDWVEYAQLKLWLRKASESDSIQTEINLL